jgi:hypothetical protein
MRQRTPFRPALAAALPALALALAVPATRAGAPPRTLVLALDGVPHRVVEQAREAGAFSGWPPTSRLIAPFPSMTNVSFTLMTERLGTGPAAGYELQHYDWERDEVTGGNPLRYAERSFDWKERFDVASKSLGQKLAVYTRPLRHVGRQLKETERALAEPAPETLMVHLSATDALQHLKGDEPTLLVVLALDEWIDDARERHRLRHGRDLRVLLLSDHGNSCRKIRRVSGLKRHLRDAGLRPAKHLRRPHDVVVSTFGMAGYGALYTGPEHAETAARAVVRGEGVDLAAWRVGPQELRVVGRAGEAAVCWAGDDQARVRYAYQPLRGDPLDLLAARDRLAERGLLDAQGHADDRDWLRASADGSYPDALNRLAEGLVGEHLRNRATVLVSMLPGRAWGWKTAAAFAWLRGGRLEGTHGGLDHDSSAGFLLASDPELRPAATVRARGALEGLVPDGTRLVAGAQ